MNFVNLSASTAAVDEKTPFLIFLKPRLTLTTFREQPGPES